MPTFAQALARNVLVFDGAMGTEIYRHHVFTNRSFDELCLSDPKLIREIHRRILRRRGRRADDQHFRRQSAGAGQVRPGRKDRPRSFAPGPGWPARWLAGPDAGCSWPARSDRCLSQPQHEHEVADDDRPSRPRG